MSPTVELTVVGNSSSSSSSSWSSSSDNSAGRASEWSGLARGGGEAEARAKREATELARAFALQTIVVERDASVDELRGRVEAIAETMWPPSPLQGYGLHSSLGAYV